jgi:hypothetical protein
MVWSAAHSLDPHPMYTEWTVQSNAGFLGLQNNMGILLITFAAFLFITMIVAGGLFIRAKEASDKLKRAEMKKNLEAKGE